MIAALSLILQEAPLVTNDFDIEVFTRLLVAAALGGIIGLERELTGKEAGLRTMILICVGSALFTEMSQVLGAGSGAD
jgi:putative Mg2+ transporter-C (MgtC) family protein